MTTETRTYAELHRAGLLNVATCSKRAANPMASPNIGGPMIAAHAEKIIADHVARTGCDGSHVVKPLR
jgi:hypothetical protein